MVRHNNVVHNSFLIKKIEFHKISQPRSQSFLEHLRSANWTYCPIPYCYKVRKSYNTLRDHLFTHTQFRYHLDKLDENYTSCCENTPTFMNIGQRRLHRFKHCVNAKVNLEHILNCVIPQHWDPPIDDQESETDDDAPDAPPPSPLSGVGLTLPTSPLLV